MEQQLKEDQQVLETSEKKTKVENTSTGNMSSFFIGGG